MMGREFQRRSRLLAACALLGAMLAVLLSPLWHTHAHHGHAGHRAHATISLAASLTHAGHGDGCHHEHGHEHEHDAPPPRPTHEPTNEPTNEPTHQDEDCGLCAALHTPTGTGLPKPLVAFDRPAACAILPLPASPVTSASFLPVLWPCGPPARA